MLSATYKTVSSSTHPPVHGHRLALLQAFDDTGIVMTRDRSLQILNEYLNCLERELTGSRGTPDVGKVQEMLLEISQFVRSGKARVVPHEYSRLLGRLSGIYSRGLRENTESAFCRTAADYSDVVEAISREDASYDYSKIVGQLLYFMGQLFESRKGSWVVIYENLGSMSDSIRVVKLLKLEYLLEIQRWAEEGVANLFQIRKDLQRKIVSLDEAVDVVLADIAERRQEMASCNSRWLDRCGGRILNMDVWVLKNEIDALRKKVKKLTRERDGSLAINDLIDVNILEFEGELREVRRKYHIKLVHDAA